MRRPAAALATVLLATSVVAGPSIASAAPAEDPVPQISCGTVGEPVCSVIDEVTTLLVPLEPAIALFGPALGDLGASTSVLTALLESGPDFPPQALVDSTGAVLVDLHALTDPVLDLLRGAGVGVDPLESALAQLQEMAGTFLAPAPQDSTSEPTADDQPRSADGSSAATTSSSSSSPTGFDGAVSSGSASTSRGATSPSVPDVPVGSSLTLGPLALPSFGLTTAPATSADARAADALAREVVMPAVAAAATPDLPDGSRATAVVMALSALMLAVGLLLDQRRKARLPIRIDGA